MTPLFLLLVLPTVPIYHLLSTCIDASLLGCEEIRKVQYRRSSGGADLEVMKAKDEKELAAQYLTEADLKAQAAMVSALKLAWPGVKIVGEEVRLYKGYVKTMSKISRLCARFTHSLVASLLTLRMAPRLPQHPPLHLSAWICARN